MTTIHYDKIEEKYWPFIEDKYDSRFERGISCINEIVIHGTAGGQSAESVLNWMLTGERQENYKNGIGLFHYLIDHNGDIYKLFDLDKWFFHSHSSSHDKETIGIELMNKSFSNSSPYSDEQYSSLETLIFDILINSNITRIVGHSYNYRKYGSSGIYNCPGSIFGWGSIESMLNSRGYDYSDLQFGGYEIGRFI